MEFKDLFRRHASLNGLLDPEHDGRSIAVENTFIDLLRASYSWDALASFIAELVTAWISPVFTQGFPHRHNVLRRDVGLDVVHRSKDKAPARSQIVDPPTGIILHLLHVS